MRRRCASWIRSPLSKRHVKQRWSASIGCTICRRICSGDRQPGQHPSSRTRVLPAFFWRSPWFSAPQRSPGWSGWRFSFSTAHCPTGRRPSSSSSASQRWRFFHVCQQNETIKSIGFNNQQPLAIYLAMFLNCIDEQLAQSK